MYQTNCYFEPARQQRILRGKASAHASKRLQQRGIPNGCVPLILNYGMSEHDGKGGIRYLMTADVIERLYTILGKTKQISDLAGVYAVVSAEDGTVLTVGHRHQ